MRKRSRIFLVLSLIALGACGQNIFKSAVPVKSDKARMAEARVKLDDGDYAGALKALDGMDGDSNERRILMVASLLGEAGFVLWEQILSVIDSATRDSNVSGVDQYFNQLNETVFGVGAERTSRLQALGSGLNVLADSPDPLARQVNNLRCFVAGVLALPTVVDGQAAIRSVNQTLVSIKDSATGDGATAADCPKLGTLNDAMTSVVALRTQFTAILESVADCPFIDLSTTANNLNEIETKLNRLTSVADKGCQAVPTCTAGPICDALKLGCVQQVLTDGGIAGDGIVSSCEIVQHCSTSSSGCF